QAERPGARQGAADRAAGHARSRHSISPAAGRSRGGTDSPGWPGRARPAHLPDRGHLRSRRAQVRTAPDVRGKKPERLKELPMKTNRYLAPLGVLVFLLLSLVPSEGQQQLSYVSAPAQLALSYTFSASSVPGSAIPVNGLRYWQILFVPSGSVSTCALSFDSSTGSGFSTGGIIPSATVGSCASAGGYN